MRNAMVLTRIGVLALGLAAMALACGSSGKANGSGGATGNGGDSPSGGVVGAGGAVESGGVTGTGGVRGTGGTAKTTDGGVTDAGLTGGGCNADTWPKPTSGNNQKLTIVVGGKTREYVVGIPADYSPSKRYLLVFAWHGLGGTGDQVA
jgi:polyhydroxybutyrate depolymerase